MILEQQYKHLDPLNLFHSRIVDIESAYIIAINNEVSEQYAKRCEESCKKVGQKYKLWPGYDGNSPKGIFVPDHLAQSFWMRTLKITDHYLTRTELACALSHISLWFHCILIDQPIIILEHDAIMIEKFQRHNVLNSIIYLGCKECHSGEVQLHDIPLYSSEGTNYVFINRAHAYSIDPLVAKNMTTYVMKYGINMPLDMMMRLDLFSITHQGVYAYDNNISNLPSTISGRPQYGRSTKLNENLEY